MKKLLIGLLSLGSLAHANTYLEENVHKLKWNGVEVVWLEDESLPTYNMTVYFAEGALGDQPEKLGETEFMFDQLTSGTDKYSREQLTESLEFNGTQFGSRVTHEFSTFTVSGLMKDAVSTMKTVCHMFTRSQFPAKEIKKTQAMATAGLKSLISKHGDLAKRAFRYESLRGSGYETPTGGTIKSLNKITSLDLQKRLTHFNNDVFKRIYIKGPKTINELKGIFSDQCKWKNATYKYPLKKVTKINETKKIILVSVPNANQAQVQVGKIMTIEEVNSGSDEAKAFASNYLGGGFTSRLIQVLRVEQGLTYSAGAYISEQKNYGRSGLITFTKNETIVELLKSIQSILKSSSTAIDKGHFKLSKNNLIGNYLLGLESTSDFLSNLLIFDHIGRSYEEIYEFTSRVEELKPKDIEKVIGKLFNWNDQTILIVGSPALESILVNAGYEVEVKSPMTYL